MERYVVEPDGMRGFQVVTLRPDGSRQVVAWGCPTPQAAEAWIAERPKVELRQPANVI
jgi:hypothetical protein